MSLTNKQLPNEVLEAYVQLIWTKECHVMLVHRTTAEGKFELMLRDMNRRSADWRSCGHNSDLEQAASDHTGHPAS